MRDVLRFLVYLPTAAAGAIWDRLTRDHLDRVIAKHHARFIAQHEGD